MLGCFAGCSELKSVPESRQLSQQTTIESATVRGSYIFHFEITDNATSKFYSIRPCNADFMSLHEGTIISLTWKRVSRSYDDPCDVVELKIVKEPK